MFAVKICGVTSIGDAQVVASAGADAIGLNFYRPSPRYVSPTQAASIAEVVPSTVAKVGVFVNMSTEDVTRIASEVGLDHVQLHGDEPPEMLGQLQPISVIRAFRLRNGDLATVARYLDRCRQLGCLPYAILLDAFRPGQYGGTGATIDWRRLVGKAGLLGEIPLILAGGLTADNVAQAIDTVGPAAVDTASGVEERPGQKDASLVRRFVAAARGVLRADR